MDESTLGTRKIRITLILKWIAILILVLLHLVSILSIFYASAFSVKWRVVRVLTFSGTMVFFLGKNWTGSKFYYRAQWISSPTPDLAWRILGVILWSIALICFVAM
jgi:hypothetical protein